MSDTKTNPVDRRDFLRSSAAVGTAISLTAQTYGQIHGANARIGVAMLGAGARAQAHINVLLKMRKEGNNVVPVGVCDVWDGQEDSYEHEFPPGQFTRRNYSQGLYPSAKKCGLSASDSTHVTRDYRRLLELKEVDAVCIATPDHWHARMTLDALAAGKDVYCEKPMTRSATEAQTVVDAAIKFNRVVTVGVQAMADPSWLLAHELVRNNKIGPLVQAQAGIYRNDIRGQWRYYRLTKQMTPKSIDWDLFLGHQFAVNGEPLGPTPQEQPFDRATFAQWRCQWAFSGGPYSDLLAHKATQMLAATGLRYPRRVVGMGGLFWEHDGREVPDVATLVADYDEGCQLLFTSSTISGYPVEDVIRGRFGVVKFVKGSLQLIKDDPLRASGLPARLEKSIEPAETINVVAPNNETQALWEDFLQSIRSRNRATLCPPELAAAAVTLTDLAVRSYRNGQTIYWDKEHRRATSDSTWAERWEERSERRERAAGMLPPKYMNLAGPWTDGKAPEQG